jgi:hypothetical protein
MAWEALSRALVQALVSMMLVGGQGGPAHAARTASCAAKGSRGNGIQHSGRQHVTLAPPPPTPRPAAAAAPCAAPPRRLLSAPPPAVLQPSDLAVMRLFEDMTSAPAGLPPPAISRPSAAARAALRATAGGGGAGGGAPGYCSGLSVGTAFESAVDPATRRRVLRGRTTIANAQRAAVAVDRVGVRLCSRTASAHVRVRADCPRRPSDDFEEADVPPGGALVCTWSMQLPAAPEAGWQLSDWTGVYRWAARREEVLRGAAPGPPSGPSAGARPRAAAAAAARPPRRPRGRPSRPDAPRARPAAAARSDALLALEGDFCEGPMVDPATGAPGGTCSAAGG